MKDILSNKKTAVMLLIITIVSIGFYAYMLVRPISYGMSYNNRTVYDSEVFEGKLKFYPNGKMSNKNTNFGEEFENYYYYKDGYVFTLISETKEGYDAEVAYIDANFDEAVNTPYYASKINAFRQVSVGLDNYATIYTCTGAFIFAIVFGAVELALIVFTFASFLLCKKRGTREVAENCDEAN
jgi:hypothetical protein